MATTEPKPERCGARTRSGGYCEKHPAKGSSRCRFHGGASTGPSDTSHLEENDYAEGNPGGGAPELNTNGQTANGIWSNWRKVYDRLPEERKEYVDELVRETVEKCEPYTPDMTPERREELAREYWVLLWIQGRIDYDIFAGFAVREDEEPAEDARGMVIQEDVEIDGETYTVDKTNPAIDRRGVVTARRRKLRRKLKLPDVWQDKTPPGEDDVEDQTLAEALSDE